MIEYKGYVCHFVFNEADKLFHGKVANSHYPIDFQGKSVYELTRSFQEAIDEHISWCLKHETKNTKGFPSF